MKVPFFIYYDLNEHSWCVDTRQLRFHTTSTGKIVCGYHRPSDALIVGQKLIARAYRDRVVPSKISPNKAVMQAATDLWLNQNIFSVEDLSKRTGLPRDVVVSTIPYLIDKGRIVRTGSAYTLRLSENPRFNYRWLTAAALTVGAGLTAFAIATKIRKPSRFSTINGSTFVEGIDVSHAQGTIDWGTVANSKTFTFIKATEGTDFFDPNFTTNWTNSQKAGLLRGAYHFFHPTVDPIAQAKFFLSKIQSRGDLPPVLDVEWSKDMPDPSADPKGVLAAVTQFVDYITNNYGRPIIYTSPSYWNILPASNIGDKADLWVADWTMPVDKMHDWNTFAFWQYSEKGQVAGIVGDVDLDRFNGSTADLQAYSQSTYV